MKQNTNQKIFVKGCETAIPSQIRRKICMKIHNDLGFVTNVEVLFNRNGQKPGEDLQVKLEYNHEKSNEEWSYFETEVEFFSTGYRAFFFKLNLNGKNTFVKYDFKLRSPVITDEDYPFFETFVYNKDFKTPSWVKGGVVYHIYIDTFNAVNIPESVKNKVSPWGEEPKWLPDPDGEYRNDKFFGGNLEGIIAKIPYLKNLGVTILYISPIFKSDTSNRYSIKDYNEIDEMVGNWEILEKLYKIAHENGMHIILDVVFNHCSPENELYKERPDLFTGTCWWGFKDLVEIKMFAEDFKKFLRKLLFKYYNYSDGIRIDVADCFPDDVLKFIREVTKECEIFYQKELWIVGEVWKNGVTGEFKQFFEGYELDSVMNYQFAATYRYIRWGDHRELYKKVFYGLYRLYPKPVIDCLMNLASSHDIPRMPNILTNPLMLKDTYLDGVGDVFPWDYDKINEYWIENGVYSTLKRRTWEYKHNNLSAEQEEYCRHMEKLVVFLQFTLPGVPSIFAGDEFGVMGLKDPFNRRCIPWKKEDNVRQNEYRSLSALRKSSSVFFNGDCEFVYGDEEILIYKRQNSVDTLTFAINRTNRIIETEMDGETVFSFNGSGPRALNPFEAIVFREEEETA